MSCSVRCRRCATSCSVRCRRCVRSCSVHCRRCGTGWWGSVIAGHPCWSSSPAGAYRDPRGSAGGRSVDGADAGSRVGAATRPGTVCAQRAAPRSRPVDGRRSREWTRIGACGGAGPRSGSARSCEHARPHPCSASSPAGAHRDPRGSAGGRPKRRRAPAIARPASRPGTGSAHPAGPGSRPLGSSRSREWTRTGPCACGGHRGGSGQAPVITSIRWGANGAARERTKRVRASSGWTSR